MSLQGLSERGRVAVPMELSPRPSLVPDDVWRSYQRELEREQREEEADEVLESSEAAPPSEETPLSATVTADLEVAQLALSQVDLFQKLDRACIDVLTRQARQAEVPAGGYLFVEGQHADCFYVVLDGALEVIRRREGREVALRHMHRGEAIGLFGLFSGQRRAACARAIGDAIVLSVPCTALNEVIGRDPIFRDRVMAFYEERLLEGFLGSSKLFSDVDSIARARLIARFIERRFKSGEAMVQPGEVSNLFAILITGRLMLESRPKAGIEPKMFQLDPGQYVAVTSAFSGAPCKMRIYAAEDSTVVMLGQRELADLLRDYPALRALSSRLPAVARALDRDIYCGHTGVPGL